MNQEKRTYRMRKRAESKEETRQRIVEATMQLHEEVGPRATTISAIADRAGVQRLTVYRHFPDETAVFKACTSHWLELNPPPDPADWSDMEAPLERVRTAVAAFYGYYAKTRRMWSVSFRDVEDVPALQEPMADVAEFVTTVADDLTKAFGPDGAEPRTRATIRHILQFPTWSELDDQGLDQAAKLDLVMAWISGARDLSEENDVRRAGKLNSVAQ